MARLLLILAALLGSSSAIWIGEEYWASINHDGSIREGRTQNDFLTFDAIHQRQRLQNAYVAFWITTDQQGHYEAFGQARVESDGRVCGQFIGRYRQIENICGGFRVLARHEQTGANPFRFVRANDANLRQAVTYRRRQIAKITSWQKNEAFYGGVSLNDQTASGIDYDLEVIEVHKVRDPAYYDSFVEVLIKENNREPEIQPPASLRSQRRALLPLGSRESEAARRRVRLFVRAATSREARGEETLSASTGGGIPRD